MCKCRERKYQEYCIQIKYLNGDIEQIKYSKEDVNPSNYKDMIKVYHDIREQFKENCCTIQFCGRTQDEHLEVMFEKEIITEDKIIKENAERIANLNTMDLLNTLQNTLDDIIKLKEYCINQESLYCKQQDSILHEIENNMNNNISNEEKIKTYNELESIRFKRRVVKENGNCINMLITNFLRKKICIDSIISEVNNVIKGQEKYYNQVKQQASSDIETNTTVKEVRYRNDRERLNLMKQLEPKYNKIINVGEEMKLMCYNKCKKI